jgi:hypothetical protein
VILRGFFENSGQNSRQRPGDRNRSAFFFFFNEGENKIDENASSLSIRALTPDKRRRRFVFYFLPVRGTGRREESDQRGRKDFVVFFVFFPTFLPPLPPLPPLPSQLTSI